MPLVKFFHCVSFLNQTLFQSSSTYSFFPSHCLIRILLFLFYASFYFFLSGPLPHSCLFPVSVFHFKPCHSLFSFFCCKVPLLFFYFIFPSSLTIPSPHFSTYQPKSSTGWMNCYWMDELLFSCMQITLKSVPISDQAPGSKLQRPMHYLNWPLSSIPIQRLTMTTAPSNPIDCQLSNGV